MTSHTNSPSVLSPIERALRDSLRPPEFRDVHLYAFTRRTIFPDGSIQIDHPLPVVAIGSILKDTEHFSKLLTSGFAEAQMDGPNPIRQCAHESEYDYESDSDLDEFEELEDRRASVPESSAKGKFKAESSAGDSKSPSAGKSDKDEKLHRVLMPSIAYRTLKSCVFYLYTDKINFLPLTSKGSMERQFALLTKSDTFAPPCSPKSMYRLAEGYGITKLQDMAYDEIISQLTPQNIVSEAFSSFFARYDRLREHAVSYLSQNYSDPAIQEALPDIIDRIVLGDLPHASEVLRSLLGLRVAIAPPFAIGLPPGKTKKKAKDVARALRQPPATTVSPVLAPYAATNVVTAPTGAVGTVTIPVAPAGTIPTLASTTARDSVPVPSDDATPVSTIFPAQLGLNPSGLFFNITTNGPAPLDSPMPSSPTLCIEPVAHEGTSSTSGFATS